MKALDALLEGLFDHAGMFPPRSLSFDDALQTAAKLHETLERPSLVATEMVVTPDDLHRIDGDALQAAGFERPCRICLVGVHVDEAPGAARTVMEYNDEARLASPPHEVVTFEMHGEVHSVEGAASGLMPARYLLAAAEVQIFWEPTFTDTEWNERLGEVFDVLDAVNGESELPTVGLKVRCGGDRALSPATLAHLMPELTTRRIPFKATQGLHHPLAGMAGNDIGFLGLATALRLHAADALPADKLEACIAETEADAFSFDDGLGWRDHRIDIGLLGQTTQPVNIGSCDLHEPDAELAEIFSRATAATN